MKINFINSSYRRFYAAHKLEIDHAIKKCLEKGELTLRQEVWKLEENLAKFIGIKYALGLNSGTDAIFLALKALGIKQGDEVITPSHTFIASLQAIVHCGATPILIDVKGDELMDVSQIERYITSKTKAILPIQYTGKTCEMEQIMRLARDYRLHVIEDAAQALGARYKEQRTGSFGEIGCFSFNTAKLLGAYGDGGAIVTNDIKLYERIALLRNHWNMSQLSVRKRDFPQPEIVEWGWKSRLDNIQAAVLNVKFKYLPWILERRQKIAERYNKELSDSPFILPTTQEGQVWQEYHLQIPDKDKHLIPMRERFVKFMEKKGIELLVRDTTPNHKLKNLGLDHWNLPKTEELATTVCRLPLYPELKNREIDYIIKSTREFYKRTKYD